ncbi:MAG TPA: chemotaxis protein CheW [Patescibacteria group bacterium]|nr:chemotaxis protein CheW [Patescibacteria group bacterium]
MSLQFSNQALYETEIKDDVTLQLVSFTLGEEEFGINILQVQEINRLVNITRVPNSPDFVEGVINLRGKIIPIVDLRKRFGMPSADDTKNSRIVVVELSLSKVIGFLVDSVQEVLRISSSVVEPPPAMVGNIAADYITGVGKLEDRLLILLDLEKVLNEGEIAAL